MRYKLSLSYDGSKFCGWQVQPAAPSVQQTLEEALGKLLGEPTGVTGAGRTDTGVNAINYIAHFDCGKELDCGQLRYKLNAILPHSIAIQEVSEAPENFHARFDATNREYTYFLHTVKDPFLESYSFLCTFPLDFDAMNKAASFLLGKHDFSCFEKVGADNKTSICTIQKAVWEQYTPSIHCASEGACWKFTIQADRFLRNMVRAIVGTLLEVGRGKREAGSINGLLESHNRSMAGESVPGHALFLSKVEY